jgi:hypothetical protein
MFYVKYLLLVALVCFITGFHYIMQLCFSFLAEVANFSQSSVFISMSKGQRKKLVVPMEQKTEAL